ncbi:MAG: thioredoxin family protein [Sulfuriferula sp.]
MKRLLLVALFIVFGFAGPVFADPPDHYPFVSYGDGLRLAQQQKKPIFLYFGRYGCGWCAKTNKESFSDPDIHRLYTEHYVLVYVDAESGKRLKLPSGERITEADLGARFNAFATPLFVFLDPQGKEIVKIPGFKTIQDFKDFDRYVNGGFYKTQTLLQFLGGKAS